MLHNTSKARVFFVLRRTVLREDFVESLLVQCLVCSPGSLPALPHPTLGLACLGVIGVNSEQNMSKTLPHYPVRNGRSKFYRFDVVSTSFRLPISHWVLGMSIIADPGGSAATFWRPVRIAAPPKHEKLSSRLWTPEGPRYISRKKTALDSI